MPIYELDGVAPNFDDPASCWIAPDAVVVGNVRIGRNVSIWFGSVIRGDNEPIVIGDDSNIQEATIIHSDPGFPVQVGRGVTVGHRAMLHGCVIGDGSLVGMGAILLNGATIGRHSIVGAGSLVTERKSFEDNVLIVGSPAKAVRELDEAGPERLARSARHYVGNGARFRMGLKEIPFPQD